MPLKKHLMDEEKHSFAHEWSMMSIGG